MKTKYNENLLNGQEKETLEKAIEILYTKAFKKEDYESISDSINKLLKSINEKSANKLFTLIIQEATYRTNHTRSFTNLYTLPYHIDNDLLTKDHINRLKQLMISEKSIDLLNILIQVPSFNINQLDDFQYQSLSNSPFYDSKDFFKKIIEIGFDGNNNEYGPLMNFSQYSNGHSIDYNAFKLLYELGFSYDYDKLNNKLKEIIDNYDNYKNKKLGTMVEINDIYSKFLDPLTKINTNINLDSNEMIEAHTLLINSLNQLSKGFQDNLKDLEIIKIIENRELNSKLHKNLSINSQDNKLSVEINAKHENLKNLKDLLQSDTQYIYFGEKPTKMYLELIDATLNNSTYNQIKNYFPKDKSLDFTISEYSKIINNFLAYLKEETREYSDLSYFIKDQQEILNTDLSK